MRFNIISPELLEPDFLRYSALSSPPLAARAPARRPSTPQQSQFISFPPLTQAGISSLQKRLGAALKRPRWFHVE